MRITPVVRYSIYRAKHNNSALGGMLDAIHNDNQARVFADYLTAERRHAPRTASTYGRIVREFVAWCGGTEAALQCNRPQIQQFLGSSQRPGDDVALARSRWNLRLAALRAWYDYLLACGLAEVDATAGIRRQHVTQRTQRPLALPELAALVAVVELGSPELYRARNVAIVQTLIHTALRVGELAALDLAQLDLTCGVLLGVRRHGGKRASAWLSETATQALAAYVATRDGLHAPASESALFVSHTGERLAVRTIQEMVRKYASVAGIRRRVTPHLLRHSAPTERLFRLDSPGGCEVGELPLR